MKVAVAQIGSVKANAARNADAVCRWIAAAAADGCSLVVFAECCLTGYVLSNRSEVEAAAIDVDGEEIARIVAACRVGAIHAVVGLLEKSGPHVYNTAILIGPRGILGRHRKRHLPFLGADRFVDHPQDIDPAVFDTDIGRIGIAICYEIRFPEVVRTLALSGAELVVLPTNWPVASQILADHFSLVRAAENFVYFLVANRNDEEEGTAFLGSSQIVDPIGNVLVHAGTETGLFSVDADLDRARQKRIVFLSGEFEISPFADRKPETYRL